MKRNSYRLIGVFSFFLLLQTGCSLKNEDRADHSLQIVLDDSAQQAIESSPLSALYKFSADDSLNTMVNPSTIADFNCFVANVTGLGVPSESEELQGCVIADNMNGVGAGTFSDMFARGQSATVEVPSGPARRIDIYGVYPGHCGGGSNSGSTEDSGYYLGGVTKDLEGGASVIVPISYSGGNASITCTGGGGNGGGGSGFQVSSIFPYGGIHTGGWGMAINGNGFGVGTTVTVDGTNCPVTNITPNTVQCTVPFGTIGPNKVVAVTNASNQSSSVGYFQYVAAGIPFISVDKNTSDINFGNVVYTSGSIDITVVFSNTGDTDGVASESLASTEFAYKTSGTFPGMGGTCGPTLSGGNSCTVVVTFDPTALGAQTTTLSMFGMNMTLNGTGI